jgi:DNA-binding PadR family transcriptional regulator
MRKWLVTLAVLGVGGVGAYLLSDKGQDTVRRWLANLEDDPGRWDDRNESAQAELEHIQAALNRIARSLGPQEELSH